MILACPITSFPEATRNGADETPIPNPDSDKELRIPASFSVLPPLHLEGSSGFAWVPGIQDPHKLELAKGWLLRGVPPDPQGQKKGPELYGTPLSLGLRSADPKY